MCRIMCHVMCHIMCRVMCRIICRIMCCIMCSFIIMCCIMCSFIMIDAICTTNDSWCMIHDSWCMMHDGAFQYISYIYRVSAPSIPKISVLPFLEPTEKISNTHTYIHTHIHTSAHTPHYYIDYRNAKCKLFFTFLASKVEVVPVPKSVSLALLLDTRCLKKVYT